jgi:hypothetical protein
MVEGLQMYFKPVCTTALWNIPLIKNTVVTVEHIYGPIIIIAQKEKQNGGHSVNRINHNTCRFNATLITSFIAS